ncbi:MAG: hypothetical protein IMF16_01810, partial [Proteobacteria bacterium]|nr:hypothetical protein [Pseudomonadota bacterium]
MRKMEADCQVTIKGLPEPVAQNLGKAVAVVVKTLGQAGYALDLRRMHRVVVTADFAGELSELSGSTASGNPITYTQEEYAIAVGKVVTLPRDDGDREIVLVIDARIAAWFAPRDGEGGDSDNLQTGLHLLHHELCHIHDTNKMIDAFPSLLPRERYAGKDILVRPLAELCWAEY